MSNQNTKKNSEWFHKLKLNSWEVEILIVGFVLVMLFQVSSTLNFETYKIYDSGDLANQKNYMSWTFTFSQMLAFEALIITVNILIYSFGSYLSFRGFWVGLLGLSSVFPNGINYKKLNFKNRLSLNKDKYNLTKLINSIDKICSSIFSFSFLISFSIISFLIFVMQIVFLGFTFDYIVTEYLKFSIIENIFESILIIYIISGFIFFFDFFLFSILKHISWKPISFIFYYINKFFKRTLLVFIYDHIYYIIISNVKRRYLFLILILFVLVTKFFEPIDDRKYFPSIESKTNNVMSFFNYQNQFKFIEHGTDGSYPEYPFIHSDVVSENYLKLYIPYSPIINQSLRDLCPEISAINNAKDDIELEEDVLDCINKRYIITINDKKIINDFIFYHYAYKHIKLPTFFMVVPLDDIDNGKHILNISKFAIKDEKVVLTIGIEEKEQNKGNEEIKEWEERIVRIIPFYLQRD